MERELIEQDMKAIGLLNGQVVEVDANETQVLFISQVFRCLDTNESTHTNETVRLSKLN